MDTGPYSLFDDENFGFIFQTCVHFIGCVNLFEENDKETGKHLTTELLLKLRKTCQNCLQFFDSMNAGWQNATDHDLNLWIIDIDRIIREFKNLMAANIKELDEEAKNSSLPDIVKRLEYFIKLLISQREVMNQNIANSRTKKKIESNASASSQDDNVAISNNTRINTVLNQFNTWLLKIQSSTRIFKPASKKNEQNDEHTKLRKSPHEN